MFTSKSVHCQLIQHPITCCVSSNTCIKSFDWLIFLTVIPALLKNSYHRAHCEMRGILFSDRGQGTEPGNFVFFTGTYRWNLNPNVARLSKQTKTKDKHIKKKQKKNKSHSIGNAKHFLQSNDPDAMN